jgi:hypothetical protein
VINFKFSPTGRAFVDSRAFVKIIMGPVGGGKSTVALRDLYERALAQKPFGQGKVRRTKFLVVRNTSGQLMSTVKPLIDHWFVTVPVGMGFQAFGNWRVTEKTFEMKFRLGDDDTIVHTEFVLLAADTPDDVRRLLSAEYSAAWLEEGREIDPEVAQAVQGRVARFPNQASGGVTYPGVIVSMNPPPLGTYWHEQVETPPRNTNVFKQPSALTDEGAINPNAENLENLDPSYYENLIEGKSEAWLDVYLRNKFGAGEWGNPVYRSTFRRDFHTTQAPLSPVLQSVNPLIVGMDNGLTAAAVLLQQDARGRVNVLDECFVPLNETMGVETFLDRLLVPKLRNEYPFRPENIVFVLDPACFQRSQVDEKTIAQAVMNRGFRVAKASTNDPERRVGAVEQLLARQIDGKAGLLFGPKCPHLTNAMDYGYRYKKSAAGQTTATVDKNHFSHVAEALQYGALHYDTQTQGGLYRRNSAARPLVRRQYVYT